MFKCAITGANGVLGKKIKKVLPFKFYPLNENILNYNKVFKWVSLRKYDLVIHLTVLEHIVVPVEFMRNINV